MHGSFFPPPGLPTGMWLPAATRDRRGPQDAGLQLDPQQLADLTAFPMGAIVSLKGCSGSSCRRRV